jgi:TPP-dependent pyruvate/acetoin dehydrogenase alpha subunit
MPEPHAESSHNPNTEPLSIAMNSKSADLGPLHPPRSSEAAKPRGAAPPKAPPAAARASSVGRSSAAPIARATVLQSTVPEIVPPRRLEHPAGQLAATTLEASEQRELYRFMMLNRLVEDRLSSLYRQNKVVGGLYSSRGQEAISVGSAFALAPQDFIGPLIRNLGAMLVRGVQPREVFTQYMARGGSPTGGKDCNLHFGDVGRGIISPISMLGALIPVMAGVALAGVQQKRDLVAMTWIGDGGTSTGDFHEGLNLAAVLDLPLVLIAEHNGYAYSTPTSMQMRVDDIAVRAAGYGIPGSIVDGNDVLAVYEECKRAVDRARAGEGPSLIEVKTFRMKGHAEHDDAGYVPRELLAQWQERDPIQRFEHHLLAGELASRPELEAISSKIKQALDVEVDFALNSELPPPERALEGVYEEAPPEVAVPWSPTR